ncbi:MAG: hypothetical protein ACREIB_03955, partial [Pseudomonadota bacterium]
MIMIITYTLDLIVSIAVTIWVARTLSRNGRIFLVDSFAGRAALADSVNHLLVVGFYLINVGYVTLALRHGERPFDVAGVFEYLSGKIGLVLLVLGGMHFFNMFVIARIRRQLVRRREHVAAQVATAGFV